MSTTLSRSHAATRVFLRAAIIAAAAAPAHAQLRGVFFADIFSPDITAGAIKRVDGLSSGVTTIVDTGGGLRAVAVDSIHGKVYWADADNFVIRRANLDGSGQEDIVSSGLQFPSALALDLPHGKLYWGDQSAEEIHRCDLDGSNQEFIASTPFYRGLAIDTVHSNLYWTTTTGVTSGRLIVATLEGGNPQAIAGGASGTNHPTGVAVDPARNRLFWTDAATGMLWRAALDGSGPQSIYTSFGGFPSRGIDVDPATGDVYFGADTSDEPLQGSLYVAHSGEAVFDSLASGLGAVNSVSLLLGAAPCYANCDGSTVPPILNVNDFICFQTKYAQNDAAANCDGSTAPPVLNVNDFICFQTKYAQGCP